MWRVAYNLLFPFASAAMLPGVLGRMFRRGNYRRQFGQRFGFYSTEVRQRLAEGPPRPWIQAVSVGELFVALKLIAALREACPGLGFVLSTTTTTGMQLARERVGLDVEVVYTPIDSWGAVRRAFDVLRPSQITIVDGGLWPNLLWEARRRGVPTALANARLSPRSERRFRQFAVFTRPMFGLLDLVCATGPAETERWEKLGVPPGRIECTGSVKFDDEGEAPLATNATECPPAEYLRALGVREGAPVLLAASTHPGEERMLAGLFCELRKTVPGLFLIVAPRHAERASEVRRELTALGLSVANRSDPASVPPSADALLLDTTGELREWPPAASVVFIGKSLTAFGGQNPAEAAAAGKPAVFGPHMENFAGIVAELLGAEAAYQARGIDDLRVELHRLLSNPEGAATMGQRGREVLATHRGAARRTAGRLVAGGGFSPCH